MRTIEVTTTKTKTHRIPEVGDVYYINNFFSSIREITGGRVTVKEVIEKKNGKYAVTYAEPGFEDYQPSWDEDGLFSPENQQKLKEKFGDQIATIEHLDGRGFDDGDWN